MSDAQTEILEVEKPSEGPSVTGCVDAITGDRVFGWAWDPQRTAARVAIRIEVGGKPLTTTIADQPREDLATNGIGDGAHAFEVALASGISPEKIAVFAVCPESGETLELTSRPAEGSSETGGQSEQLRTAVHALYRSQRFLHGKLQSLADAVEGVRKDAAAKASEQLVSSRLETLEVAVARIDDLLRNQATMIEELKQRRPDNISRVLACAAVLIAGAACFMALV